MTVPERLGRYRIDAVLGEGAMGVVYKGFDPGIRRVVALKTIRRQLMHDGDEGASIAARFRNEAQAAGRLSHPGIVAVYDFGDEGDIAYIAMEFIEGSSLARYLAVPVPFDEADSVGLMVQLLDALEHAHAHGVWHRDIKPANLMLTQDGRLKVADFGIARIEAAGITMVSAAIGTPGYMAPEQFLGHDPDRRVDLYAAGVLLYQLLIGRPPFSGSTESLMYRVVHEAPVLPSALTGHGHQARFDAVLGRALAKDRTQRFGSAAEFRQALLAAHGQPAAPRLAPARVMPAADATTMVMPGPGSRPSQAPPPPTNWDAAVLSQLESTLARHVGPLASVLVRRGARDCTDLTALHARLAEQITDAGARSAFLASVGAGRTGSNVRAASTTGGSPSAAFSEALLAQSTRLLAAHIGPIAGVLVKRAAARSVGRPALFAALLEAVTDPAARQALQAELDRLP